MKNKIKISKISKQCFAQKGFEKGGCFTCKCKDSCCKDTGADFDKESYDLVMSHKNLIEPLIKEKIENCFKKNWSHDKEFLGHDSIKSVKGNYGFCVFHNPKGRGCVLYNLVKTNKINKRMVPSICRLFPLSWERGKLLVYTEQKEKGCVIPKDCNCLKPESKTSKNILETQKNAINNIFDIDIR